MIKEKTSKKEKRKLEIKELAEIGIEKINENKFLLEKLSVYQSQIDFIKNILDKKSKLNFNNSAELSNIIKNDFLSYYKQLNQLVENLRESNKKLLQKYEMNYNIIFDEWSLNKCDLKKNRIDFFILDYEIKQKNDVIKKLNENVINSKRHSIFRENKRESETGRNTATNYINSDNLYAQRDLQVECRNYNRCINRIKKREKKIGKMKEIKKSLSQYINYSKNENISNNKDSTIYNKKNDVKASNFFSFQVSKKRSTNKKKPNNDIDFNATTFDDLGKNYQFGGDSLMINEEEDVNKEQTYISNNNNYNSLFFSNDNITSSMKEKEKEKKKKVKEKFKFLTFEELFDLENVEGEKELIIQEELHSDDEVVFEKKIKNKNRINTEYLSKIKKQVPGLFLNQIEFNKKKVMNEADLYSFQRREFNRQNIDQNIKTMKKKIKIMKRRKEINRQKLKALMDFDKKAEEQYESLKKVKVLSSVKDKDISFMKKEFYNYRNKKYNNDVILEEEEKAYTNKKKYDDEEEEDGDDIDDYSDEMRKRYGKTKRNNNNNYMITEDEFGDNKKKANENKFVEYDDDNKAKSK